MPHRRGHFENALGEPPDDFLPLLQREVRPAGPLLSPELGEELVSDELGAAARGMIQDLVEGRAPRTLGPEVAQRVPAEAPRGTATRILDAIGETLSGLQVGLGPQSKIGDILGAAGLLSLKALGSARTRERQEGAIAQARRRERLGQERTFKERELDRRIRLARSQARSLREAAEIKARAGRRKEAEKAERKAAEREEEANRLNRERIALEERRVATGEAREARLLAEANLPPKKEPVGTGLVPGINFVKPKTPAELEVMFLNARTPGHLAAILAVVPNDSQGNPHPFMVLDRVRRAFRDANNRIGGEQAAATGAASAARNRGRR